MCRGRYDDLLRFINPKGCLVSRALACAALLLRVSSSYSVLSRFASTVWFRSRSDIAPALVFRLDVLISSLGVSEILLGEQDRHGSEVFCIVNCNWLGNLSFGADGEHERPDIHERCRAYLAEALPELPSAGRSGSVFNAHL